MNIAELLRWQWSDYSEKHGNRVNLLLHIVAVPLFLIGFVWLACAIWRAAWWEALGALAAMAVSLVMQGRGHRLEKNAPTPFSGPVNAASRLFVEQWITFPRFVFSGGWYRNLTRRDPS